MADPRDEIARIIESAERAAYERGWRDATDAITGAAEQAKRPSGAVVAPEKPSPPTPRRTGRPSSPAIRIVEDCITATPGMKGVDVVKAAQSIDGTIKERTVRTCLRRLRLQKKIWKRNGLWYPKAKDKLLFDNVDAEVAEATSH